jgi:hypothetical protein
VKYIHYPLVDSASVLKVAGNPQQGDDEVKVKAAFSEKPMIDLVGTEEYFADDVTLLHDYLHELLMLLLLIFAMPRFLVCVRTETSPKRV